MIGELDGLYREIILEHYKSPAKKGELTDATVSVEGANPLCGDELVFQLLVENQIIKKARFGGTGCAISQAAASMLADELEGKSLKETTRIIARLKAMMQGEEPTDEEDLGDLEALAGVSRFPVRIKCAALSWNVIEQAIEKLSGSPE